MPLVIEEYLDLSLDDLENDLYLKICPDSRNKLVYCDNDICYYDCFDGDYLCIATKDTIKNERKIMYIIIVVLLD
ncbi:MAG: hypothetical protein L6V91_10490 [Bacilli bacterium]|nr:MAG: hypothetical protein L6V91_10490 [Bacilli bacterium]